MIHSKQTLIEKIQSLPSESMAEVENFVDLLKERATARKLFAAKKRVTARKSVTGKEPLDFPVDDLGPWPEGLSLRRKDIYNDGER